MKHLLAVTTLLLACITAVLLYFIGETLAALAEADDWDAWVPHPHDSATLND